MSADYPATLAKYRDCGAKPGRPHNPGCGVERCSVCGGQFAACGCSPKDRAKHDPVFARWTGVWPGYAEAAALGYWVRWDRGWIPCERGHPDARPDLNRLYAEGLHRVFFRKPGKETGA